MHPVSIALSGISGSLAVSGFCEIVIPPTSLMPPSAAAPSPSKPDIVLQGLGLKSQNSLQAVKLIKTSFEKIKVFVMDLIPLKANVYEYIQAGISGFILKDANINEFFKTIRIELISEGFTNKEIAQKLHLSIYTIKSHVHNILEKLTLHTRVQIVRHIHVSGAYNTQSDLNDLTAEE